MHRLKALPVWRTKRNVNYLRRNGMCQRRKMRDVSEGDMGSFGVLDSWERTMALLVYR